MGEQMRDAPRDVEMENIRAWWAAMPEDQRRACLIRNNPAACPCGAGGLSGHPCAWCMPHPAWLMAAPTTAEEAADLLDGAVAALIPNCNPRAMPHALGTLHWLANVLRGHHGRPGITPPASPATGDVREREEAATWVEQELAWHERWIQRHYGDADSVMVESNRDIVRHFRVILAALRSPVSTPEREALNLARRALAALDSRAGEDVDAWADRIGADLAALPSDTAARSLAAGEGVQDAQQGSADTVELVAEALDGMADDADEHFMDRYSVSVGLLRKYAAALRSVHKGEPYGWVIEHTYDGEPNEGPFFVRNDARGLRAVEVARKHFASGHVIARITQLYTHPALTAPAPVQQQTEEPR